MTLRYPPRALLPDLVRAAIGLVIAAGLLTQLPVGSAGFWVLAVLAAVFGLFGALTALRAAQRIERDGMQLRMSPGARRVRLDSLARFKLDYYATRRDREGGWMQLTLADRDGNHLRVDSRLDGFAGLVKLAAEAASRAGLELEPATLENLRALLERHADADLDGMRP